MNSHIETIVELNAEWGRMIDARDVEGIVNLYRPDGAFLVPGQPAFEGHDAIRAAWQFLFGLPDFELRLSVSSVDVSGDASFAMNRGAYSLSYGGPEKPVVEVGKYLIVWRAEDGAWKVAADIFNSDAPS